jgi:hypothetical protein
LFTPEKRVIRKYDREDVRVTKEYVQDIQKWITPRDLQILELLLWHPFLTVEQIEMMVFNNMKPSCWRNKANERLRRLYRTHCIDRWFPPVAEGAGSAQQHIVLDRAGAEVLALSKGYKEAKNWRKRTYIPQTYRHTLKIFDFKAMLYVLNRQIGMIDDNPVGEILAWRMEHQARIDYRDEKGRKGEVIPDALCVYKYTTTSIKPFFLEADNATMDLEEQLKPKIRRYIECHKSGAWREKDWARLLRSFPPVLIVMHDKEDVRKLAGYIRSIESKIRFLLTTYDQLIDRDFLVYENESSGKSRSVLTDMRVNILEPIWICPTEQGRVSF